ncbi:uncharacterized conserved protein [Clostridium sp. CAG:465]|nr:uncharacterized conserved protein [Clostridium sp. CAG:465]
MRIGIDIDGVLTDIEQWQLDVGGKFFSKFNKSVLNKDGYEITKIFNVSDELDSQFWNEYLYDYVTKEPSRKYASEVIKKLKDDGNEIYIVTARYLTDRNNEDGEKMRKIVVNWLAEQKIDYDEIIFSPEDKKENCKKYNIDIMIEDKVDNINKISSIIPVICFHAGYNNECKGKNIYRVYNWYDIYNLINGGKICKTK